MLDHYSCTCHDFNPQGSREPRRALGKNSSGQNQISIHKALASLDYPQSNLNKEEIYFNPQGSREPRRIITDGCLKRKIFQSTRLSRASTSPIVFGVSEQGISIHKALASLDLYVNNFTNGNINFNPQGSREPRQRPV